MTRTKMDVWHVDEKCKIKYQNNCVIGWQTYCVSGEDQLMFAGNIDCVNVNCIADWKKTLCHEK